MLTPEKRCAHLLFSEIFAKSACVSPGWHTSLGPPLDLPLKWLIIKDLFILVSRSFRSPKVSHKRVRSNEYVRYGKIWNKQIVNYQLFCCIWSAKHKIFHKSYDLVIVIGITTYLCNYNVSASSEDPRFEWQLFLQPLHFKIFFSFKIKLVLWAKRI